MPRSAAEPLRLAIVNDYEIVVAGLVSMLAAHRDRVVLADVVDPRFVDLSDLDVILFDTFARVTADHVDLSDLMGPTVKLAVFTWNVQAEATTHYLAQGASGYLSKSLTATELVDALEAIHRGCVVISPDVDAWAGDGLGDWPCRALLSAREAELMALIAKGLTNQEIADALYLSINSIKTYVRGAYKKIGVTRRSEAVIWALQNGFAAETGRVVSSGPRRTAAHVR